MTSSPLTLATSISAFAEARRVFHAALLDSVLFLDSAGVPGNADSNNAMSRRIAVGIAERLRVETIAERLAGQRSGNKFESICAEFVRQTFLKLGHLRPGNWSVEQISGRRGLEIAKYQQYSHLEALDSAARGNPVLAAALGNDYTISPDIVVSRVPETDDQINALEILIDDDIAQLSGRRGKSPILPLLHASISCKWTIRSDRAQNSRSEALNLIRNRKGRLPHIVVVTAEPTPNRLASIALGTGDIDCVYHFALYELQQTLKDLGLTREEEKLAVMVEGSRLKDISDLPLDLAD